MDLKLFVLSLVTDQNVIPLFLKTYSGNASDKMNFDGDSYYIGDSATYTKENVRRIGKDIIWISRVPATINKAKDLLDGDFDIMFAEDSRYAFYTTR